MQALRPTYTHEAIVKLLEKGCIKHVISQNLDGLHRLSGVKEGQISELHGNTFVEKCEKCKKRYVRNFRCGGKATNVPVNKCKNCRLNHRTGRVCDDKVIIMGKKSYGPIRFPLYQTQNFQHLRFVKN